MQMACVHQNHRVVVWDSFITRHTNEKQLHIPDIHDTIAALLITTTTRSADFVSVSWGNLPTESTETIQDPNPKSDWDRLK